VSRREPAVAGGFYPADPDRLRDTVDTLLAGVDPIPPDETLAAAYVVPHAALRYSGGVAAQVYARLRAHAEHVRRVVLVGPAHFVPLRGSAVPTDDAWLTPLGAVAIAEAAARELVAHRQVGADDEPHAPEHSLEVQLPLLQRAVPDADLLPIVVGRAGADEVALMLRAALAAAGPGSVLLCSTDLSHYLTQEEALVADRATIAAIEDRDPERIGDRAACGLYALRGLLTWATAVNVRPRLLAHRTSFDATGDPTRVVGYSAMALDRGGPRKDQA
jgi:AmmeMemoRadiSam system protein B